MALLLLSKSKSARYGGVTVRSNCEASLVSLTLSRSDTPLYPLALARFSIMCFQASRLSLPFSHIASGILKFCHSSGVFRFFLLLRVVC